MSYFVVKDDKAIYLTNALICELSQFQNVSSTERFCVKRFIALGLQQMTIRLNKN